MLIKHDRNTLADLLVFYLIRPILDTWAQMSPNMAIFFMCVGPMTSILENMENSYCKFVPHTSLLALSGKRCERDRSYSRYKKNGMVGCLLVFLYTHWALSFSVLLI